MYNVTELTDQDVPGLSAEALHIKAEETGRHGWLA